jgi:glycosyltransferase involved in cell wall biosynthesis
MNACVAASVGKVLTAYEPDVRTCVIHSAASQLGVDPVAVARLRTAHQGKFLVGHVAALDNKTKGQIYIIRAARELQHSHPHIRFLLIGGGADESWLRGEARDLGNLSFVGFVNNIGDYLSVLDVFILPSNIEGVGGVLLDAMQFGLPVIASRVGGLPEIVHDGENGFLIQPHNPQQLNEAILRLHDDRHLGQAMGAHGKEFVSNFTPDKMAGKYFELYQAVLGGKLK